MNDIVELNLSDPIIFKQWQEFLISLNINDFSANEVDKIDQTIGIFEGERLVATGSIAGNILKYIAVCNKGRESGTYFNTIISDLTMRLAQQNIFHLFVFTKPEYVESFKHVGFQAIAVSKQGAILESGDYLIQDYLNSIVKFSDNQSIAGIVMNANPFTLGHRYLIETAAKENDQVYVFVVNTDASLFSTSERTQLIEAGTADLDNVTVVNGADYMVSFATFPAYFIKSQAEIVTYQTTLDALIFKNWIAKTLHIQTRYLGSEPHSETTNIYNQVLKDVLEPEVKVKIVDRKKVDQQIISARDVREAIRDNHLEKLSQLVPQSTINFISSNLSNLQQRIQKGMNIDGN